MMRTLCLSDSALGDLVCSSVVIANLLSLGHEVSLVTRPELGEFAGFFDHVAPVSLNEAQARPYDWIVDLTSSSRTRKWMKTLRGERKFARYANSWQRLKMAMVYDVLVPKNPERQIVRDYHPLIHAIGGHLMDPPRLKPPKGTPPPSELEALSDYAVIHIGAGNPLRALPERLTTELVEHFRDQARPVILIGTEKEAAERVKRLSGNYPVHFELSLTQLAQVLIKCTVFLGPDSGPLHLAAALGTRAVGVYGPNLASRSGPLGTNVNFVEKSFACRPCNQNRPCPYSVRCLNQLGVTDFHSLL